TPTGLVAGACEGLTVDRSGVVRARKRCACNGCATCNALLANALPESVSRSIVMRDGIEARWPKAQWAGSGGERRLQGCLVRQLFWGFAPRMGALWGDHQAVYPAALQLGAGSLTLLGAGERAHPHAVERSHIAHHGLIDLGLARGQRVGVFTPDTLREGLRFGLRAHHSDLDAEATFGLGN